MKEENNMYSDRKGKKSKLIFFVFLSVLIMGLLVVSSLNLLSDKKPEQPIGNKAIQSDEIVDGVHVRTGLKEGEGLMTVVTHCTACHSAQLITQNRMNKERWNATIRWMQETQNLWDLGENQEVIVNYLVENYPVYNKGRRENIQDIEWYELSE